MTSRILQAMGVALVASMAVLTSCGPAPTTTTTTSEQSRTTIPAPPVSTTTTTTNEQTQRP